MIKTKGFHQERNSFSVLAFQIEGVCAALRQTVPHGLPIGKQTIQVLTQMVVQLKAISEGQAFDNIPAIDENSDPQDVLLAAEITRSTVLAFLSPEDLTEQKKIFGFASNK